MKKLEEIMGAPVQPFNVDLRAFSAFMRRYHDARAYIHVGKKLEYFISEQMLQFTQNEIYVDVASQDCPFAYYVNRLYGTRAYRQDLYYLKPSAYDLVGDACKLPFAEGQVAKISLHNSLEHFVDDSDSRFIEEAQRILAPGGLMVVTPLDIAEKYSEDTEAGWIDDRGVKHLWSEGAQFARTYDPEQFKRRVLDHCPGMRCTVYQASEVDEVYKPYYFAMFEKL